MKKCFKLFMALVLAAFMSCSLLSPASAMAKTTPKKVAPVSKKVTVNVGDTFELKVKMTPANADDDSLVWSIKKGKTAIAFNDDNSGDSVKFTAKKAGNAKVMVKIGKSRKKAVFSVKVNAKSSNAKATIKAVGAASREVYADDSFTLKVKNIGNASESDLKWSIKDSKYVAFDEDDDKTGTEADFEALAEGKTTIICTNTATNETITYTIKVVADSGDDEDSDDGDDEDGDDDSDDDDSDDGSDDSDDE